MKQLIDSLIIINVNNVASLRICEYQHLIVSYFNSEQSNVSIGLVIIEKMRIFTQDAKSSVPKLH